MAMLVSGCIHPPILVPHRMFRHGHVRVVSPKVTVHVTAPRPHRVYRRRAP
jgi:hypothetical protein